MGKKTTISVVTPSFNQGAYLKQAIVSVLQQNKASFDYFIVDGKSSDSSLDVIRQYSNVVNWISEKDSGPAEAINKGFSLSSGNILYWLNADDIIFEGVFEKVIHFFDEYHDIDVIYGDAVYLDEFGNKIGMYPTEAWNWSRMKQTCIISQPAAFFRRKIFDQLGPLNITTRIMDYDFWLRLGVNEVKFLHVPELFAGMRRHNQAFSINQRLELHRQANEVTRTLLGYTPGTWLIGWGCAYAEKIGLRPGTLAHVFLGKLLLPIIGSLRWNGFIHIDLLQSTFKNAIKAAKNRTITPNI